MDYLLDVVNLSVQTTVDVLSLRMDILKNGQVLRPIPQFMYRSNSLRAIFLQYFMFHYTAIIKGESQGTNCDKPTEYYIDKVTGKITTELEEAVGRDAIDLTRSQDVQASLKE